MQNILSVEQTNLHMTGTKQYRTVRCNAKRLSFVCLSPQKSAIMFTGHIKQSVNIYLWNWDSLLVECWTHD